MAKLSKTECVVAAMSGKETVTICNIRHATGFTPNEIGGILASLERQGRVRRAEVAGATRNHWCLLKAKKRSRAATANGELSYFARRRMEEEERENSITRAAVELQNIVLGFSRARAQSSARAH